MICNTSLLYNVFSYLIIIPTCFGLSYWPHSGAH